MYRSQKYLSFAITLCFLQCTLPPPQTKRAPQSEGTWAVDPHEPGEHIPAKGRSLFDVLVFNESNPTRLDVPFPFTKLVARIQDQLSSKDGLKAVLIPLGRSLQRESAFPDFFKFPRIVMGVDGESKQNKIYLKDRFFLAYQEKANALEVISYNESLGRFEFQIVKDYAPQKTPQVLYASRDFCIQCHQNQGPLFPVANWKESNATSEPGSVIQSKIAQSNPVAYHSIPVQTTENTAYKLDQSTDRASQIMVYQKLWRELCHQSPGCRTDALLLMVQRRLTTHQGLDATSPALQRYKSTAVREWIARWPQGLAIPDPNLPDRTNEEIADDLKSNASLKMPNVPASLDPKTSRIRLEQWNVSPQDPGSIFRMIEGLAENIPHQDLSLIDTALFDRGQKQPDRTRYSYNCSVERFENDFSVICGTPHQPLSEFDFTLSNGQITGLMFSLTLKNKDSECVPPPRSSQETKPLCPKIQNLKISGTWDGQYTTQPVLLKLSPQFTPFRVRAPNGNALEHISIAWNPDKKSLSLELVFLNDFNLLEKATAALSSLPVLKDDVPFLRHTLMNAVKSELGINRDENAITTLAEKGFQEPPPLLDETVPDHPNPIGTDPSTKNVLTLLDHYCGGACHGTTDSSTAPFLSGSQKNILEKTEHCAPKIYYRLKMGTMPPLSNLRRKGIMSQKDWLNHPDHGQLMKYITTQLDQNNYDFRNMTEFDYEGLACLEE